MIKSAMSKALEFYQNKGKNSEIFFIKNFQGEKE